MAPPVSASGRTGRSRGYRNGSHRSRGFFLFLVVRELSVSPRGGARRPPRALPQRWGGPQCGHWPKPHSVWSPTGRTAPAAEHSTHKKRKLKSRKEWRPAGCDPRGRRWGPLSPEPPTPDTTFAPARPRRGAVPAGLHLSKSTAGSYVF